LKISEIIGSKHLKRGKQHAGEFLRLLRELDPDEEKFYLEGYKEVEEMMGKIKK
jgi:hypothetical protein